MSRVKNVNCRVKKPDCTDIRCEVQLAKSEKEYAIHGRFFLTYGSVLTM